MGLGQRPLLRYGNFTSERSLKPSTLPIGRKAQGRSFRLNSFPDLTFLFLAHADPVANLFEGSSAASADIVALGSRADGNAG